MYWIIPALVAPFINAINNFIDKYFVSGAIKNPKVLPVYMAVISFLIGTAIWAASGFFRPSFFALFGVASGITTIIAATAYFKLMARKDVSEMIFYLGLTTPFILILSYVFLGEKISSVQLAGFIFILFACALVLFKKEEARLRWTKTLALVLTVDGMWALGAVFMKLAMNENSFIRSMCYEGWGMGLGGAMLYALSPEIRNYFFKNFNNINKGVFVFFGLNEFITIAGRWVEYFAYSFAPIALVSVAGGTQTFYCILLGAVLTFIFPRVFKEDVSRSNIFRKVIAAVILIVGLYLINV